MRRAAASAKRVDSRADSCRLWAAGILFPTLWKYSFPSGGGLCL